MTNIIFYDVTIEGVTEGSTEVSSEQSSIEQSTEDSSCIVYLDETQDTNLYLSTQVENVDLNDMYSLLLSTRNCCLLFFLMMAGYLVVKTIINIVSKIGRS